MSVEKQVNDLHLDDEGFATGIKRLVELQGESKT